MKLTGLTTITAMLLGLIATAQAAPTSTCYVNDGFAVSVTTDPTEYNDVFSVKAKQSAEEILPCPIAPDDADLVFGQDDFGYHYEDLLANHLVLAESTGPVGNLVIIDLRSGKTVLNVSGLYEHTAEGGVHYWLRGAEGTPETCDRYAELTGYGLGTGILDEMVLNLDTLVSTATGITDCEGIS